MINEINTQSSIQLNINNASLQLKEGDTISFSVIKLLTNGMYLINLKGQTFTAVFQNPPQFGQFNAEVVKTDPFIELKIIKDGLEQVDTGKLKGLVAAFNKEEVASLLSKHGFNIDFKDLTPEKIKHLIKESGIFLEHKLSTNENISKDLKFIALQKDDTELSNSLLKLQALSILTGFEAYLPFKSMDQENKDIEVFLKKDAHHSIVIRANFSVLGDTVIYVREMGNSLECTVKTAVDISQELKDASFSSGITVKWAKLEKKDLDILDVKKTALEKIGRFEIIA